MFIYFISNQVGIVVDGLVLSCTALLGVTHAQRIHSFFVTYFAAFNFLLFFISCDVTQGNTAVHIWLHGSTVILHLDDTADSLSVEWPEKRM